MEYIGLFSSAPFSADALSNHMQICLGLWLIVALAAFVDLLDAIRTERLLKERIVSHKLRKTSCKILEYWTFMFFGFLVDTVGLLFECYELPYVSIMMCLGYLIVEGLSIREHAQRRRSRALTLEKLVELIVQCKSKASAQAIVKHIKDYANDITER
jgi:hypothetical protein